MSTINLHSSSIAMLVQAVLPRYRLTEPYAKAANGTVYRGVDIETDDEVLIKVVPNTQQKASGGASWEALREETNRLGRIAHERIATLLEVVDAPLCTILVSTALPGLSLERLIADDRRPDRRTVVRWGLECLELLTEAYAGDVLHRFLSEHAVLIDNDARVRLRGFSLTDSSGSERRLLAPEQIRGGEVDGRCDLFSLGMLLGRLLALDDEVVQVGNEDPLRVVLLKAVAHDPADRYEDVLAMAGALREASVWEPTMQPSPLATGVMPSDRRATGLSTESLPVAEPAVDLRTVVPSPTMAMQPVVVVDPNRRSGRKGRWRGVALAAAVVALGLGLFLQSIGTGGGVTVAKGAAQAGVSEALAEVAAESAVSMPNKPMPEKVMLAKAKMDGAALPRHAGVDGPAASLAGTNPQAAARALVAGGIVGNLFVHADLPENDVALLDDLVADIESFDFSGDARGAESIDSLFGVNPLLGDGNTMLSETAREYWLSLGIEEYGTEAAVAHLEGQHHHTESGDIDRAGWYEPALGCQRLCGMVVVGLLYEHIKRVEVSPHELLLFPTDSADVDTSGHARLADFVASSAVSDHVLLIGRGSRTGDRAYNLALSQRRVEAVREVLRTAGVADGRLHRFALGYEPPQLTPSLLRRYGIDTGSTLLDAFNQSVLVVAYEPAMASPVGGRP